MAQEAKRGRFAGSRVLITCADRYYGPPIVELFRREGADVIADTTDYTASADTPAKVVAAAGLIDIFVPLFAGPTRLFPFPKLLNPVTESTDEDLQGFLDELLWPMTRFIRAVLPQMYERRAGKVVAVTSASPMRAIEGASIYSGVRGYQNAFLRVVGAEAAHYNVQVNAVAPAFLENASYVPQSLLDDPAVRQPIVDAIPADRVGTGIEVAELVLALAGPASDFMAGQAVPLAGGWVT